MTHRPVRRAWPLRWLPARCKCGCRRFDACPDAVSNAMAGEGQPLGGPSTGARFWRSYNEHYGDPRPRQAGRWA